MPKTFPTEPGAFEVAMRVRAETTVEWWLLLDKQIKRAQKLDPDLAAELIEIRASLRNPDHTPGDMTGLLGALALQGQSQAVSAVNKKNASKPRADDEQLARARTTFDAWGGATMTPEKRRECELDVARDLGTNRTKITRWFNYFLNP
jgi:hypothetical protein